MATNTIGGTGGDAPLPVLTSIDRTSDLFPFYSVANLQTAAITPNNILGITGAPVGNSDSQTLTNKTLDNTNAITIKDGSLTLQNSSSVTKQAHFVLSSITAGQNRAFTLPDYNATLATQAGVETLTNKTLTSPTINTAVINNPTLAVDSISGFSTGTIVSVANLSISNGVLNTNNSVITSNITDGAVTPAKLQSGTGGSWAYSSWSPTWANLTVGNGTVVSKYIQTGKMVEFYVFLTFGTTTSVTGTGPTFTLPVTASSDYSTPISGFGFCPIGIGALSHSGTGTYLGYSALASTTTGKLFAANYTTALYIDVTATVPATWASTDIWVAIGRYQAA